MYGGVEDGQRVLLASPVDVSAYPGVTVYYNPTQLASVQGIGYVRIKLCSNTNVIGLDGA